MYKLLKENLIENGHISAEKKLYDCKVDLHCHDFFEFEYIIDGSGVYSIDGKDYEIHPGMLFFMTPVNFHSVDMKKTSFFTVMFSADMCKINILSRLFSLSHIALCLKESDRCFFNALLCELCESVDRAEYASLILETLIYKISSLNVALPQNTVSFDVRYAELYILEGFKRRLTLSEVARRAMLSESHFSRKFSFETGKGFKEYLNDVRFEHAKKLLLYSEMTVTQICNECGFDDYPNFIRHFKVKTGQTPTEFRSSGRLKA